MYTTSLHGEKKKKPHKMCMTAHVLFILFESWNLGSDVKVPTQINSESLPACPVLPGWSSVGVLNPQ